MKKNNVRLAKIIGMLVCSAMIFSMSFPVHAASAMVARNVTTSGNVYADLFEVSAQLSTLTTAAKMAAPTIAPQALLNAPFDAAMPEVDAAWDGANQGNNRAIFGTAMYPPNTAGAASSTHYIQVVNNTFTIWDLTQNGVNFAYPLTVYGPMKLSTLWQGSGDPVCETRDDSNLTVLYDENLDAWLLSQIAAPDANGPYYECIAVSQSGDPLGPLGTWNLYRYSFNLKIDHPTFGVWQDGYYLAFNQTDPTDLVSPARGAGVAVFERSRMSDIDPGVAANARMLYINTYDACVIGNEPECHLLNLLPADADGTLAPDGTPNFFAQIDDDAWGYAAQDQLEVWKFTTDWQVEPLDASGSFDHLIDLAVNPFDSEICAAYPAPNNCIPQPGTTVKIDAVSDRLMPRLQFRNFAVGTPDTGQPDHFTLVTSHTVDVNQDAANTNYHAGIRWYEIQSTDAGSSWSVYQQSDFAPDSKSRWLGSVAMDVMGNIALGYSISSSDSYPNIAYAGRLFSDPLNSLPRTEQVLLPANVASGSQTGTSQWGSFSTLDVAPDGCYFFYTNEYLQGTTPLDWSTAVGMFMNDACWFADVTVPDHVTTIDVHPISSAEDSSAHFQFSNSTTDLGGFQCQLDGGAWQDCSIGSMDYSGLAWGSHTFAVRAFDYAGNFEVNVAEYTWSVADITSPETTIDTANVPSSPDVTMMTIATFSFSGDDGLIGTGISGFECDLDNSGIFTACTSPKTYTNLGNGSHTFSVRAVDKSTPANVDATPAEFTWEVGGVAEAPDSFYVSGPLLLRLNLPSTSASSGQSGSITPLRTGFQIPRKVLETSGARSVTRAATSLPFTSYMPVADTWWDGLNQGNNRVVFGEGVYPPDANGAASSTYYLQTVNNLFAVWDITGATPAMLYGPAKISGLWKDTGDSVCDTWDDGSPTVLYDENLNVWLLSQVVTSPNYGNPGGPYYMCIAVSQTDDPLGTWNLYRYASTLLPDYPKFGIWQDGYYMSFNQYDPSDLISPARGSGVAVFERASMSSSDYATASTARMIYINPRDVCVNNTEPECHLAGLLPSDADGDLPPDGTPNYFMQVDDGAWGYSNGVDQLEIWTFATDWTAGTGTLTHLTDLPVNSFDSEVCTNYDRNCIPQPGTTAKLDAISDRLMYRLQFRSFAADTPVSGVPARFALVANHTVDANADTSLNNGYAGIRWYELQSTDLGGTWSVYQQGNYAPDSKSRWMGSIAMDKLGNISLGYSVSSSSFSPNIAYVGRLFSDPLNSLPRTEQVLLPTTVAAGSQTGTAYRWGNSSMLDIASDGCNFFYTNEYLRGITEAEWSTAIGQFKFNACVNGDADAPSGTTILTKPRLVSEATSASFTFSNAATDLGGFQCQLDGNTWVDCSAGTKTYTPLALGSHTFRVRAFDSNLNFETTPATYTWKVVSVTIPDTTIKTYPAYPYHSASAKFTFAGSDAAGSGIAKFQCSLDGKAYVTCASPKTYTGLSASRHTFRVRALDYNGHIDPLPAVFFWVVTPLTFTARSTAAQDGWVQLTTFSAAGNLRVGDDAANKAYRSILSFNTAPLNDRSKIVGATLKLTKDPINSLGVFSTLGALTTDIKKPSFGTASLTASDFGAPASLANSTNAFSAAYSAGFKPAALQFVNKLGLTQVRLRFTTQTNSNSTAEYLSFFSGESVVANQPLLVINYLLP